MISAESLPDCIIDKEEEDCYNFFQFHANKYIL